MGFGRVNIRRPPRCVWRKSEMLFLTVLVWLGSLAVLVGMASLGRLQPARKPSPPSPRRRVWRLACGASAVGLAALLAAMTIREAASAYGPPEFLDLRVPASGAPDPDRQPTALKEGRFLLHMILAECGDGLIRAIRGKTEEVRWTGSPGPAVSDRVSRGFSRPGPDFRSSGLPRSFRG